MEVQNLRDMANTWQDMDSSADKLIRVLDMMEDTEFIALLPQDGFYPVNRTASLKRKFAEEFRQPLPDLRKKVCRESASTAPQETLP